MGQKGAGKKSHTPVMRQFLSAKAKYPDAIVFFRLGDFYEMFYDDARRAAALLDIALTSRGTGPDGEKIPMAGVPHHAAAGYLAALLRHGEKVAICEQMVDPSSVKGVVPREVVRVVTPGLCLEPESLDARAENHLVALSPDGGLAALELSTGDLRACETEPGPSLLAELVRLDPAELLVAGGDASLQALCREALPKAVLRRVDSVGDEDWAPRLRTLLQEADARVFVEAASSAAGRAAVMALSYAQQNQPQSKLRIHRAEVYTAGEQLVVDEVAVRNLEITRTLDGERRGSLLHLLDDTKTPMGARRLRRNLLAPLTQIEKIRRRHDLVELFFADSGGRAEIREHLSRIGDLERLAMRTAVGLASPRDLGAIRNGLGAAAALYASLDKRPEALLDFDLRSLRVEDLCADVCEALEEALVREPPAIDRQGGIFAEGHLPELDELRRLSASSKDIVLDLEQRERQRTGVPSLKVKYTRVFGYYIEISKSKLQAVPDDYVRKQTVANAERFITAELAELQDRILHAEERSRSLELEAFAKLREELGNQAPRIHELARAIAEVDAAAALAEVAHRFDYVRPQIDASTVLDLEESRHPTVERYAAGDGFVPNSLSLDADGTRLMLLTGPNMAGKSTVMRQAALCVILAQAGSFVPARRARIGVVDRIYTRVGASDQLARGQSTFMVEMTETSNILRGATKRSFVILDEIGRGTSTYDGLAIAWSVAEHLHDAVGCRAMFATHYHELCALAEQLAGAANYNVAAQEHGEHMIFLHKLMPGGSNRSYGLAVARLAGIPPIVLARAKAKLGELEALACQDASKEAPQLALWEAPKAHTSALRSTLQSLDLDHMTPVDALVTLARLVELAERED